MSKEFIHLPVPGVKAHKYIKRSDIKWFQLNYGAEEERLSIVLESYDTIDIPARPGSGITMADLDAIVYDILNP